MLSRDSLEFVRTAAGLTAPVRVIEFAVEETERDTLRCAEAGAAGYVPSNGTLADLVNMIRSVSRGKLLCSPRIAASLFKALRAQPRHAAPDRLAFMLTGREQQIAPLLDRRLTNKAIAAELHIEVAVRAGMTQTAAAATFRGSVRAVN